MARDYVQLSLLDLIAPATPAPDAPSEVFPNLKALLKLKYSLDEAKVLMAGFSLVWYRREDKKVFRSCKNLKEKWVLMGVFPTFAAAERCLKEQLQREDSIETTEEGRIPMHGQNAKRLYEVGFDFYRKEEFRIKQGSKNWANWFKGTPEEVNTWWKRLMEDDEALQG